MSPPLNWEESSQLDGAHAATGLCVCGRKALCVPGRRPDRCGTASRASEKDPYLPHPREELSRFFYCGDVFGVSVALVAIGVPNGMFRLRGSLHSSRGVPWAMWCFTAQPCCLEQQGVFAVELDEEEGWSGCQLVT